ncbi:MAG TPA: hypothetical protein VFA87_02260 [Rhizomicrobium sp.]|nr:hypothetical protein [Rhizomicrobium sp.]
MSDKDWITPDTPVYVLCKPPEEADVPHMGLLWGRGDPGDVSMCWHDRWAVVKVASYRESTNRQSIEFKDHELIFEGDRAESVEKLISLGADPAAISIEIQVREGASMARTGFCGTSIVTGDGFADAGACGYARAGAGGIAKVGESGTAVAGDGGLAVVEGKRHGNAIAGNRGIAIGEGRFKRLSVGDRGIAIAASGRIWLGDGSVGIGDSETFGRNNCIVIGSTVSGGPGSVLIARGGAYNSETDEYETYIACGIVGRDGIQPWVQYGVKAGHLVPVEEAGNE